MRPRMTLEMEGLAPRLTAYLRERIEEGGPVTEAELWNLAMEFFTPKLEGAKANLIKNYRLMYGRKIGKNTAEKNIINNFRLLLSEVKKDLLHSERPVILGRDHHGRVFYEKGQEGRISAKVRDVVMGTGSRADEVLKGIRKGPFYITPSHRKAADMLEHYGLVEIKKIGRKKHAVLPGQVGVAKLEKRGAKGEAGKRFPKRFRVWEPFRAGVWVLKDGPEQKNLRFDVAAWDPKNRIFYLGLDKEYVGKAELRKFKERAQMLHLPAKLVVFCGTTSKGAREYAKGWGIEIRERKGEGKHESG